MSVHLILQLGYFKAKRQFFVYALEAVSDDLEHILRRYFPARRLAEIKTALETYPTGAAEVILKLFDYRLCTAVAKAELEQKAQRLAMLSAQPVFILREVVQYLSHQRVVAPGCPPNTSRPPGT